jgi:hypothetical protein
LDEAVINSELELALVEKSIFHFEQLEKAIQYMTSYHPRGQQLKGEFDGIVNFGNRLYSLAADVPASDVTFRHKEVDDLSALSEDSLFANAPDIVPMPEEQNEDVDE